MTHIINGKQLAQEILKQLSQETRAIISKHGIIPKLDVILVGNDSSSEIYVKKKQKACQNVGMLSEIHHLPEITSESDVLDLIKELNKKESVHAILVQLPLPKHIKQIKVINSIATEKDVDGFNAVNTGNLLIDNETLVPCTPKAVIRLLENQGINVESKDITIVNASNVVGKPLAMMLTNRHATVTVCHSKTRNLSEHTKKADILVTATGVANLITSDMVKQGAVVIDVGICRTKDGIQGDVNYEQVKEKTSAITPVPGGVGPMTVSCLLENTLICYKLQINKST